MHANLPRRWPVRAQSFVSAHNVDVPDVVLGVRFRHAPEAESLVKTFEKHLRRNSDPLTPARILHPPYRLCHQRASGTGSAGVGMCHDSPDRRLGIPDPRREQPRIRDETPARAYPLPSEKMLGALIESISIEVHAVLFDYEHDLTQLQRSVKLCRCQRVEPLVLPRDCNASRCWVRGHLSPVWPTRNIRKARALAPLPAAAV